MSTNGQVSRAARPGSIGWARPSRIERRSCKSLIGTPRASRYTPPTHALPAPPTTLPEVPLTPRFRIRAALAVAALALVPAIALAAAAPAAPAAKGAKSEAPKSEFTLLYGDNHAFGITPPQGWTVDDTSGMGSKIRCVLYPKGQTWASAPTVMYVNPLHQKKDLRRTLAQMIAHDIEAFGQRAPRGKVTPGGRLATGVTGKSAEVRYFAPEGGAPTEAVAYVAEDGLVMLLVLSSRDAAGFRRHLPAFESLVGSYQFVIGGIETGR